MSFIDALGARLAFYLVPTLQSSEIPFHPSGDRGRGEIA
jgi:hypothetical protein